MNQISAHLDRAVRQNLGSLSLYLSLLRRRLSEDAGSGEILTKVEDGFTSLETMIGDWLNYTTDREPSWRTFSLRWVVDDVLASVDLPPQGITARVDIDANLLISADQAMLRRAVMNLVLNACDAMPNGGELVITGCDGANGVELEIADSGVGLSEAAKKQAFEPFFSTKQDNAGLGLAIVERIARAHGGRVRCANCPEGGAAFTLSLPRVWAMKVAA
jgi:signal transduction histidine kinase